MIAFILPSELLHRRDAHFYGKFKLFRNPE